MKSQSLNICSSYLTGIVVLALGLLLTGATPVFAATYTVTSTDDPGDGICDATCTLREAITAANGGVENTVDFNIDGGTDSGCTGVGGVCTITPTSELPNITGASMTINGYTQPGAVANINPMGDVTIGFNPLNTELRIAINGASAGAGIDGFTINNAANVVIKGLNIHSFPGEGMTVMGASATGIKIQGNFIGTDSTGEIDLGNVGHGIEINSGAVVTVGTDGDEADDAAERNLISGNELYGLCIAGGDAGSGTVVAGNFIGTDKDGVSDLGNSGLGIRFDVSDSVIGTNGDGVADDAEGNLISGNNGYAVTLAGNHADRIRFSGNIVGLNALGDTALGYGGTAIWLGLGTGHLIGTNGDGTSDSLERNIVSGGGTYGIRLDGGLNSNTTIAGNYVGVGRDGISDLGNAGTGIYLKQTSLNNIIGGDEASEANIIAYNGDGELGGAPWAEYGIFLNSANIDGNQILGNIIFSNYNEGIKLLAGANSDQPAPNISTQADNGTDIIISGTATSEAIVQLFVADSDNQEGQTYIDQTTADVLGDWSIIVTDPYKSATNVLVATATDIDPTKGTSQFSGPYTMTPFAEDAAETLPEVPVVTEDPADSTQTDGEQTEEPVGVESPPEDSPGETGVNDTPNTGPLPLEQLQGSGCSLNISPYK